MTCHVQFDILRYESKDKPSKILDIGLKYDGKSEKFRIRQSQEWRWRDPSVPLHTPSDSGKQLTETEKQELIKKVQVFQEKHPGKFEAI